MNPTKEFRDYLISQGAALVGLAPTREYYELYNSLSDKLNTIVTAGAKYLTDKGYHAYARTTDQEMTDSDNCIPLSHQTIATRAGLGWIGKNNRLVTPQYGSAVRISSLLTDAKRISHFLAFLSPLPTEFLHIPFHLFHPNPTVH